ncbi:MAG: molybdopterin-guanine dinucleotide biosynthesis protein B [Candidatus Edwardsbacteria bacterium]|nr:molybdopterin-guanine dinucleotide biosynthesis protein B [Candidatus Edwardsbacteria bacterium]
MLPIISIVGPSDSGKTTLIEKLVRALSRKGRRIGVLKHTHAKIRVDQSGTDTDRFRRAGAALSAITDDTLLASFREISRTLPKTIINSFANELDLLIVEGYKKEALPKILFVDHLIVRQRSLQEEIDFKGIAATYGTKEIGNGKLPHFRPSEISKLTSWIERTFIQPRKRSGTARVVIDGRELPLKPFAAKMIKETNRGLLKSLKCARGRQAEIFIDFGGKI